MPSLGFHDITWFSYFLRSFLGFSSFSALLQISWCSFYLMPFSLTLSHTLPEHSYPVAPISTVPVQIRLLNSKTVCPITHWASSTLGFSTVIGGSARPKQCLPSLPQDVDHLLCHLPQWETLPPIKLPQLEIWESFLIFHFSYPAYHKVLSILPPNCLQNLLSTLFPTSREDING